MRRCPVLALVLGMAVLVFLLEWLVIEPADVWIVQVSLVVVGVAAVAAVVHDQRAFTAAQRRNRQLAEVADERMQLLRRLLRAADHDRHRMAMQLHGQAVGDLLLVGSMVRDSSARLPQDVSDSLRASFAPIREDMLSEAEQLRQLMVNVAPGSGVGAEAMQATISAFAAEVFAEDPAVVVEVEVDDDLVLDWTTETIAYQVVRRSLENVQRHAHARHVRVVIASTDDRPEIIVSDDGIGFDVHSVQSATGLETMRMFASLGHGVLDVSSVRGAGTQVHVLLDVSDERTSLIVEPRPVAPTLQLIAGEAG